jgi:hypothetical protein
MDMAVDEAGTDVFACDVDNNIAVVGRHVCADGYNQPIVKLYRLIPMYGAAGRVNYVCVLEDV